MKKYLTLVVLVIFGCSGKLLAATSAEYEAQIAAILAQMRNLQGNLVCLQSNLVALVGKERAKKIQDGCCGISEVASSGLTVSAAPVQPMPTLAPLSAARIPFTKVTFTASAERDEVIDDLIVQRDGLSVDDALDSIILLDEGGLQMGFPRALNARHQARLTEDFTVKAGQSRTLTIAGNRPLWGSAAHHGMIVALSLVGVNTSATVSGSFPITGAAHTINEGLRIGSVTASRGLSDPGTRQVKNVGTTQYTFSSIRILVGSAEDARLNAIRWHQSGSATATDLQNVKTFVDGIAYSTLLSTDGKYYTSVFGRDGILVSRNISTEITIRGDIVGGAGRTVDFDIEKRADLHITGEEYGFGIIPSFSGIIAGPDSAAVSNKDYPWYDAAEVTVDSGDIAVSVAENVPNQNIAVNIPNQTLGSFKVTVNGEHITVQQIGFKVELNNETPASDVDDITGITLVDKNGAVVAGPVDGSAADSRYTAGSADGPVVFDGSVVFTDSVTFPIGTHTYLIKGKVTDLSNLATVQFKTTPWSDFVLVRGLTTGADITPVPASIIALQIMTVRIDTVNNPRISKFSVSTSPAGGQIGHFEVEGVIPSKLYNLEGSSNFQSWKGIATVSGNLTSNIKFDVPLPNEESQFFRLVLQ